LSSLCQKTSSSNLLFPSLGLAARLGELLKELRRGPDDIFPGKWLSSPGYTGSCELLMVSRLAKQGIWLGRRGSDEQESATSLNSPNFCKNEGWMRSFGAQTPAWERRRRMKDKKRGRRKQGKPEGSSREP